MRIVGIGHQKDVGKDTFARFLSTYLRTHSKNLNIRAAGFADKLKDIAYSLYSWGGLKRKEYYDENYAQKNIVLPLIGRTPRDIWIAIGNQMRAQDPNVWLNNLLLSNDCDYLIVYDMRFPNEYDKIKELMGITVKLTRPGRIVEADGADEPLRNHSFDYTFNNSGDLSDLMGSAEFLGKVLLGGQ